jgi:hypothetical protein
MIGGAALVILLMMFMPEIMSFLQSTMIGATP